MTFETSGPPNEPRPEHPSKSALPTDEAAETRGGERLDEAVLERYLSEHLAGFEGKLWVKQFPKGHSNLTYLIGDGSREWVLRRPPFGSKVKTAHDMGREYRILSRLHRVYRPAPEAYLHCEDTAVIGAPFYVMKRVKGVVIRKEAPKGMYVDDELAGNLSKALVDNLFAIHRVDLQKGDLADLGRPAGYIERQVSGWTRRYQGSKTDDVPTVELAATWLAEKLPHELDTDENGCLIHNDMKFDNLVLDAADPTQVVGVLDWEMATLGHPLMDLGTAMSYWVQANDHPAILSFRFTPTCHPGYWTRRQIVDYYAEISGRDIKCWDFFHVYGLFKTAVVAQQIYYRFKTGKTDDPRFEAFIMGVNLLGQQAAEIIEKSSL